LGTRWRRDEEAVVEAYIPSKVDPASMNHEVERTHKRDFCATSMPSVQKVYPWVSDSSFQDGARGELSPLGTRAVNDNLFHGHIAADVVGDEASKFRKLVNL
jgi:hypothetical protein